MEFPKLSIVIACYNDQLVSRAIESAKAMDYPNKEVIVVDDGSNMPTKSVIYNRIDSFDFLVEQENQGQSIARNKGIRRATGKYILNLDSDDYFEPSFARKAIEQMKADPMVKIVTCKARRFDEKGTIDTFTPRGGKIDSFLFSNSALGSSMFRKKDWEAYGGYEEKLPILGFEDWEFYIQILKNGGYAYVIPETLFHYHVRPGSTTSRIKYEKQRKFKEIILKHSDLYVDNFVELMNELFNRLEKVESEKYKIKSKIDYRLGEIFLMPIRKVKGLISHKVTFK